MKRKAEDECGEVEGMEEGEEEQSEEQQQQAKIQRATDGDGAAPGGTASASAVVTTAASAAKVGLDRNRRMFGSLLSHLGKAKQAIVKDSKTIEKQHFIAEGASKRNTLDAKIKAIDQELVEIRHKKEKWLLDAASVSHLLLTLSTPHLTWLPAKHCAETRALLERKRESVEMERIEREKADDAKVAELEAKKRLLSMKKTNNKPQAV